MSQKTFHLTGQEDTRVLGETIGKVVMAGDLLYLDGELGAGKTTLTKAIASSMGLSPDSVTSPTYTLVHEHRGGRISLYHFDLYRIDSPADLDNLAFDDYLLSGDGALVIEWARMASGRLPEDAMSVQLTIDPTRPDDRTVDLCAGGVRSGELLSRFLSHYRC